MVRLWPAKHTSRLKSSRLYTRDELPDLSLLKNPHELILWVTSGQDLLSKYETHLQRYLETGCNIKMLLLDIEKASDFGSLVNNNNNVVAEIEATRARINRLAESAKARFEARTSEEPFYFSMVAVDIAKSHGYMWVELYGRHEPYLNRPSLFLSSSKDRKWITYFYTQFEREWGVSSPSNNQ